MVVFTFGNWDKFCRRLAEGGMLSAPAREISRGSGKYLVLKHDVETNVGRACRMAEIESKHGHRGSYYVQAYLMSSSENIKMLEAMRHSGHEISYHHDVMDSCKGNLAEALSEFEENRRTFEANGFIVQTVCQHGNPVIERVGYTSNRDFFRSAPVQERYPGIADIMVDFQVKADTVYKYYSDAGWGFKLIYDPINDDRVDSSGSNIGFGDLDELYREIERSTIGCFISTHPHRWTSSAYSQAARAAAFRVVKGLARTAMKIPAAKRIMSRYYYLAKKI